MFNSSCERAQTSKETAKSLMQEKKDKVDNQGSTCDARQEIKKHPQKTQ
jgi:hypothetical protein